jgi:pantothenate kinase
MIFAREVSNPLTSLVKKIDAATVTNSDSKMGSFVVFCSDDEALEKKLKDLAEKEKLEKIALAIDNPAGPDKYNIAKEADITVVLYVGSYDKGAVKANYTFKKGEMKDKDIDKIVEDLAKILPDKK